MKITNKIFSSRDFGFSDLLLYANIIDEGIIVQTDGSFLTAYWFQGADLETSAVEELNIITNLLNNAFSLLGSGWMFHIDTIRHTAIEYPDSSRCFFSHVTPKFIDDERSQLYKQEGIHFENSYALCFTFCPDIKLTSSLRNFFYPNKQSKSYNLEYYLPLFKQKVDEIQQLLLSALNMQRMNSQDLLSYIYWCISGEKIKLSLPKNGNTILKNYLASQDLIGGDNPKIGNNFIKLITVSGFPNESYPGILDAMNYINFEYRWNTRFIFLNKNEATKIIDRVANLWYQKRIGTIDTLKLSLAIDSHIKVNKNAESKYQDAEDAKYINESGESNFGYYTTTVIVMDDNYDQVTQKANQIRNLFTSLGFSNQIERFNSVEAYLGSLPGYSYANVRKWIISTQNVADLMPNTAIWSGSNYHPCEFYGKNSPPLFYAKTTGATPLRISLHVRDNGHTLILGPTGSGKSTLLNFIVAQHFRYQNATVFIFDKNKSSLPLCYACDGNFYDIGDDNNNINFQPLANLETDNDFDFAAIWLEELCKLNGLMHFNDSHRQAIYKGLELMRNASDKNRRTLSYFRHLVHDYDKSIANILDNFSQEQRTVTNNRINSGFIAKIFDSNKGDEALLLNNFNVFEMGKLMELGDKVIIPAIRYLIHIISKQFLKAKPTLVVFDESFIFFNHPLFRQKIIEWIKTVRKFNVAIIFATQELNDLFKFDELRSALKTNCATKIFLPNRKATTQDMYEQYRAMDLNYKQIELIANGIKGEYFYLSEMGNRKFNLELNSNDVSYALIAKTSHKDIIKAIEIYKQDRDMFVYNWLQYNQVNPQKCQKWLDFKENWGKI